MHLQSSMKTSQLPPSRCPDPQLCRVDCPDCPPPAMPPLGGATLVPPQLADVDVRLPLGACGKRRKNTEGGAK